jgi:hypothetical protein
MDSELQKLIRHLQEVKCPPSVLDRVAEQIPREKTPKRSLGFSVAWAISIACLISAVALWQWNVRQEAQRLAAKIVADRARAERALVVVQQTREAFGYIGQALLRAAAHTENVLLKEAVPPLRNGFETVKNKITDPI